MSEIKIGKHFAVGCLGIAFLLLYQNSGFETAAFLMLYILLADRVYEELES